MKSLAEGEGDGDCREGGFWITSKCADHCWKGWHNSLTIIINVAMDILITDSFFDIRLHECSSESLCRRMNLGINWFQF